LVVPTAGPLKKESWSARRDTHRTFSEGFQADRD
jgi:hypothetical protein